MVQTNARAYAHPRCNIIKHPLIDDLLGKLRDKQTPPHEFRRVVHQLSIFLAYEAAHTLPTEEIEVETPLEKTQCRKIKELPIIISVMRAGNGMVDGLLELYPCARVGHAGLYRDKTNHNQAVQYYFKAPPLLRDKHLIVVDPLCATGNTAVATFDQLKAHAPAQIDFLCLLTADVALKKIAQKHSDVNIFTFSIERELDAHDYLLPGVGDAGDRLYGTT